MEVEKNPVSWPWEDLELENTRVGVHPGHSSLTQAVLGPLGSAQMGTLHAPAARDGSDHQSLQEGQGLWLELPCQMHPALFFLHPGVQTRDVGGFGGPPAIAPGTLLFPRGDRACPTAEGFTLRQSAQSR